MTESTGYTQPELDLEFPTYDHYTITVSRGAVDEMETVRSFDAKTDEGALDLIDGLRDTYANRDHVIWQVQEMPETGAMYGLAPQGVVWEILVVPAIGTLSGVRSTS